MPSLRHDVLVELFRAAPALAPRLLVDALGQRLPEGRARIGSVDLSAVAPAGFFADVVVELCGDGDGAPRGSVVVEVQLGRAPDKRRAWLAYVANEHARTGADVWLLVVAPDRAIARWCARPITVGHPGLVLEPLVLHPALVPRVTDVTAAERMPELAVLSALTHANDPDAAQIGWAAIVASRRVAAEKQKLYVDVVLGALNELARRELEAMMEKYEYQSEFARKYIALGRSEGRHEGRQEGRQEGRAEGRQEGRAEGRQEGRQEGRGEGLVEAVVQLAEVRLGAVPAGLEARLRGHADPAQLKHLIAEIGAASDVDAVRATLERYLAAT